jgi:hypothetical protein
VAVVHLARWCTRTHFTCFTGTKVQILTQNTLLDADVKELIPEFFNGQGVSMSAASKACQQLVKHVSS